MSADGSFTHSIFFIASLLVAVSISGVIIGVSNNMANELVSKANAIGNEMSTSIKIINDPRQMPYSDEVLKIYVKNVGDNSINYRSVIVFIDGKPAQYTANIADAGISEWTPGTVLEINASVTLEQGDHLVKVTTSNGVSDSMSFRR